MPRLRGKPKEAPKSTRPPIRRTGDPILRRCHRCRGSGNAPCTICGGSGTQKVYHGAEMTPRTQACSGCYGRKMSRCSACAGRGFTEE